MIRVGDEVRITGNGPHSGMIGIVSLVGRATGRDQVPGSGRPIVKVMTRIDRLLVMNPGQVEKTRKTR